MCPGSVKWRVVASGVRSERGPLLRGQGETQERQTAALGQVAGLISKQTSQVPLGWSHDEQFSAPACQNLKPLYRGLHGVQS